MKVYRTSGARCFLHAASVTVLMLVGTTGTRAQQDPNLVVDAPFDSITAIDNLRKCVEVSEGEGAKLAQIRRIAYDFFPAGGQAPSTLGERVSIARTVQLTSDGLSANRIIQAIEAKRGGSCETDVKIWNISVNLAAPNRIVASYAARVDLRDCGSFLGIPYENDVGSAGANVHLAWRIAEDFTVAEELPVLTNQWKDTNWFYDFIGFAAFGSIGPVISKVAFDTQSVSLSSDVFSTAFEHEYQAMAAGFQTAQDFIDDVNLLNAPVWNFQRVPEQSGVVQLGANESTLQLTERVSILPKFGPETYGMKVAEIKALFELRFPRPRRHVVSQGESLWKIAAQYYAEPKMFELIRSASGLRSSRIERGQELIVPFYTELCEQVNAGSIVRPGDTVWMLKQRHLGYEPTPADFSSGRLNLIYPFERLRLNATGQ